MIIEEINRRFNVYLNEKGIDGDKRYAMQIIKDGQIHMTNMAIYAGFSVNGVAKLHTQILENYTFKNFYELFPEKFNNKTNGVTHRRWLLYSNEGLANLITSRIGEAWITNPESELKKFAAFADDKSTQASLMDLSSRKRGKAEATSQPQPINFPKRTSVSSVSLIKQFLNLSFVRLR
jgi:Glucan phosphorylase